MQVCKAAPAGRCCVQATVRAAAWHALAALLEHGLLPPAGRRAAVAAFLRQCRSPDFRVEVHRR